MKRDKLLQKAIDSPQNLKFQEFETLLVQFGFDPRKSGGSHIVYKNKTWRESITIQPGKNREAKEYQVDDFLEILRRHNVL